MSDIRFLQFFFSSHLDHVELEMTYFEPVGTNIYGYCGYSKFGSTFAMFWNILYFVLKFWAVKICGLHFFLVLKICGYSKCG